MKCEILTSNLENFEIEIFLYKFSNKGFFLECRRKKNFVCRQKDVAKMNV